MPTRRRRAARLLGGAVLLIALAAMALAAGAYLAFTPTEAADQPCLACADTSSDDASTAHVDGFDLYTRTFGLPDGDPPVVLLHGGPGHSSLSFKDGFDFLAADYRVFTYDQRGSGRSQIRPALDLYTIDHLVAELEALRRDVLRAEQMVIIGHSAGGALAQRYALAYPDRVAKLVLVAAIPANDGVTAGLAFEVFQPIVTVLTVGLPPRDPLAANAWFADVLYQSAVPRLYDPANAGLLRDSGPASFATWHAVSRSLWGDDHTGELARLEVETLIIYGAADGPTTGEAVALHLANLLPRAEAIGFPASGHWPFLEEPERFAAVVSDFLAR